MDGGRRFVNKSCVMIASCISLLRLRGEPSSSGAAFCSVLRNAQTGACNTKQHPAGQRTEHETHEEGDQCFENDREPQVIPKDFWLQKNANQ